MNNFITKTNVNKLYVAHSVKKQKLVQNPNEKYNKGETPITRAAEPQFYTAKSYSYDSNGGGYQGL